MITLGIDSSAGAASAAIINDGRLVSECFINAGLTHSQTLLPLIDSTLKYADIPLKDVDLIAVTNGPGSFTGIRIGVAAAKGLSQPLNIPCFPVSALEAAAFSLNGNDCIAVGVMDARCQQVYTSLFKCGEDKAMERLTDDAALSLSELQEILNSYDGKKVLIGDGTDVAYNYLKEGVKNIFAAPMQIRWQRASGAALIAENEIKNKNKSPLAAAFLRPLYLRMPQAERELRAKQNKEEAQ